MVDFARLSRVALEAMAACGREVASCEAELRAAHSSVVVEALQNAPAIAAWQHYPEGDVFDPSSHAQYFYHAHDAAERKGESAEHGHFHAFLRARGMPPGMRPLVMPELAIADNPAAPRAAPTPSAPQPAAGEEGDPWSHLAAIAIDAAGKPLRFFATNRWVTGETWYAAADVAAMLDRFVLGPVPPSPLLNRWITAMIGLYKPLLAAMIAQRDAAVMEWRRRRRAKVHVLEDRRLEIVATLAIDVADQIARIEEALRRAA